ncbi:hypothetical protein RRG08_027637 [Elysia crispata]|uniref:Uncharacterized protein n=1 Tax=Elysia crispata TaxID=231223 RepID=A0AAE1DA08_9GAST|nr:hypothetical protein RRG08_027637 [Elysia crispata]
MSICKSLRRIEHKDNKSNLEFYVTIAEFDTFAFQLSLLGVIRPFPIRQSNGLWEGRPPLTDLTRNPFGTTLVRALKNAQPEELSLALDLG